jgi:hypothetical protein
MKKDSGTTKGQLHRVLLHLYLCSMHRKSLHKLTSIGHHNTRCAIIPLSPGYYNCS